MKSRCYYYSGDVLGDLSGLAESQLLHLCIGPKSLCKWTKIDKMIKHSPDPGTNTGFPPVLSPSLLSNH